MLLQNLPTRGQPGDISQSAGTRIVGMTYPSNGASAGSTVYTGSGTPTVLSENNLTLFQTTRSSGLVVEIPVRYQYPRRPSVTLATYLAGLATYLSTYFDVIATSTATTLTITSTHAGVTPTLRVNSSQVALAQTSQTLAGAPNIIVPGTVVYAKPVNGAVSERRISKLDAGFALGRSQVGVVVNHRKAVNIHSTQDQVFDVLVGGSVWVQLAGTGTLASTDLTLLLGVNGTLLGGADMSGRLLGIGFKESSKMTDEISATLAASANRLPGSTKDYLDAFNGVSDTLILGKAMTAKGLTAAGTEMVELTALLGQASGAGSGSTSTAIGKMVGDTGSESLFRIDVFERVPAFKAILEKDLEKSGKTLKDFFKMDSAKKIAVLTGVKQQLFSRDYLDALSGSADGQIDTAMSQLFDPVSGIFGFLRKVRIGDTGETTNVFLELGKLFSAISRMGAAIGKLLGGGEGLDPMAVFAESISRITTWVNDFSDVVDLLPSGGDALTNLGNLYNALMQDLEFAIRSTELGGAIAGVFDSIRRGLESALPPGVIDVLGQAWNSMISGGFTGVGFAILSGMTTVAVSVGETLGDVVGQVYGWLGVPVGAGFAQIAFAVGESLGKAALGAASQIGQFITSGIEGLGRAIEGALGEATSAVRSVVAGSLSGGVVGAASAVGAAIMPKYSGNNMHLLNSGTFQGTSQHDRIRNAASGNLLEAMMQERAMMPSGSELVVANSSELIVPRDRIPEVLSRQTAAPQINLAITATTITDVLRQVETALVGANRQAGLSMV